MNPDTYRIRVDGQIRFECATCGCDFFLKNSATKYRDSKISGYAWTGLNVNASAVRAVLSLKIKLFFSV